VLAAVAVVGIIRWRCGVAESEVVEERQEGVWWTVASGFLTGSADPVEGLLFERQVGREVDQRRVGLLVAKP
jgi:hypothetical protein